MVIQFKQVGIQERTVSYPKNFFEVNCSDGVLHVKINRPKRLNAFHKLAYLEFGEIFQLADQDMDVRVIILSGNGRAFSSGLDVAGMASELAREEDDDESRVSIKLGRAIREFQNAISQPHFINKPIIGVAHGPCIGLAIDILTAVDIRLAAKDAVFSVREIDLGMAADIGTLQRLPRIVGNLGWVKDVAYTGRDFDANEALAQGFVQGVFPTQEEAIKKAMELAKTLALKSPVAMHGSKRSINYALDHTHRESLDQIAEFNSYALGQDFIDGCMAMLESKATKRRVVPAFAKL